MKRLLYVLVVAVTVASAAGIMAQTPDPGRGGVWVTGAGGAGGDITEVVAGAGMTGGGTEGDVTLNVIGTADAITVSADAVTIASTYVGQTSITTLGTVATGTWQATDVGVAYGGTGVSTLADGYVLLGSGAGAITPLDVTADGAMLVGDGTGDPVAESGATLRTSVGVGTGDSPEFTGLTVSGTGASALDVGGGLNIGTGNVALVGTDGRLNGPLSSTIIDDLSGANLTTLNATNISSGTLAEARLPTGISVANGGTGVSSLTANSLLLGAGTSAVTFAAPGASGNVLTSNGTVWASAAPSGGGGTSLDTGTVEYAGRTITVDTGGSLDVVLAASAGDDFTVDTTRLVVSGDETAVGINTAAPVSLLDVRGPTGTGTAPAGVLTLATNELTIVDNDQLGRIEFRSPIATAGTDAIVSAAAIWAEANATFSASVNSADIVFATAASGAATEKMRILSSGNVGIGTATPDHPLDVTGGIVQIRSVNDNALKITQNDADTYPAAISLTKSRGSYASPGDVVNGDGVGNIKSTVWSGTQYFSGAQIDFAVDGTFTSNTRPPSRITFSTNTANAAVTERMRIDDAGNVGIGTAAPVSPLDVTKASGSSFVAHFTNTTNATPYTLRVEEPGSPASGYPLFDIVPNGGASAYFRVHSVTGNVGIGEAAPNDPLHITTGTAGAVTMIRLQHDNSSTNDAVSIDANMTSTTPNTSAQINFKRVGTNAATDTIFSQTNTTGGLTERMRIRHDGLVGIGVTGPDKQLEVVTSGTSIAGFNSTATNGGTVEFERSGIRRVVIATELVATGAGSNDNGLVGGSHSGDGGNLIVMGNYNQSGSGVVFGNGATYPMLDGNSYLGHSSYRWHTVYASVGTINTSDEREKRDIVDSSLGLDFINRLRPVSYRWRDPVGIRTGDTQFFGMTAQDVDEVAPPGTAFVSKENPDSWGLSYGEFTAPMIKAIQELDARILELDARIQELEAALP